MLFVSERRRSRRPQSAIRACDVRAASLQEEPTNASRTELISDTIVSSDPTKTAASGEQRGERSEQLDTASLASEAYSPVRLRSCLPPSSDCHQWCPGSWRRA